MAQNPNFHKVMTDLVELKYPKLDQPYRFDSMKNTSTPCAPTAQNAAYSVAWVMSRDDAKVLYQLCKQHFTDRKAAGEKIGEFSTVYGMKKQEDGTVIFTAKRGAASKDGKVNDPPKVIGADLKPLADVRIWGGSKGKVRALAFPVHSPNDKSWGISLLLDTVQVTEPLYGDAGGNLEDDFGPPAKASAPADFDDFDTPKAGAAGPGLERGVPTPDEDDLPF
jgi:hypothetical protein